MVKIYNLCDLNLISGVFRGKIILSSFMVQQSQRMSIFHCWVHNWIKLPACHKKRRVVGVLERFVLTGFEAQSCYQKLNSEELALTPGLMSMQNPEFLKYQLIGLILNSEALFWRTMLICHVVLIQKKWKCINFLQSQNTLFLVLWKRNKKQANKKKIVLSSLRQN